MTDQDRLCDSLLSGLDALERDIEQLVRPLESGERGARPPNGGWSIDMILEHLCLANNAYLTEMERALSTPGAPRLDGAWRPTLGGRLLVHSMRSTWRLPAPKSIAPGPAPRENVLDAMLGTLSSLRVRLDGSRAREWRQLRLASPFARWLPLNLGDAAQIILYHGERHAGQMVRVRSSWRA